MIIKHDFIYTPTGMNRPLHIYLPDGYDQTDELYPVMYFFDGHNLFLDEDATYGKSWGLKDFLDQWGKNMIIVGMECGHGDGERLSEYLPYPAEGGYFTRFSPTGDVTFEWIINEVKPFIDKKYRTYPFRECTGIAGSSMGGLMALYGVLHHNRWFSKAACVSSAIGICMNRIKKELQETYTDPDTRVYLSWGTKEAHGVKDVWKEDTSSGTYWCNKRVADRIREKQATVKLYCQVGGGHMEADWEKLIPGFMEFLWLQ